MFTSKMNTLTGKLDWEIQSEDYDYQQELARAGFADMLHDLDRVTTNQCDKKTTHPTSSYLFHLLRMSNTSPALRKS